MRVCVCIPGPAQRRRSLCTSLIIMRCTLRNGCHIYNTPAARVDIERFIVVVAEKP